MYPPDCILAHNPARPCRPKGGFGLVIMMMMEMMMVMTRMMKVLLNLICNAMYHSASRVVFVNFYF